MDRREDRRAYWDRHIGPGRHFHTRHISRIIGKSQRTVQRYIADGRLRAVGGTGHTAEHGRVMRDDLIAFLIRYDRAGRRV